MPRTINKDPFVVWNPDVLLYNLHPRVRMAPHRPPCRSPFQATRRGRGSRRCTPAMPSPATAACTRTSWSRTSRAEAKLWDAGQLLSQLVGPALCQGARGPPGVHPQHLPGVSGGLHRLPLWTLMELGLQTGRTPCEDRARLERILQGL